MSIFAQNLFNARKLRTFSQQKLADELEVSKQMISKYEKGQSMPSSQILIKLTQVLNLNLDYFFTPPTVSLGDINFRKKSRLGQKKIDAIKEEVRIKISNYLEIEKILQIDSIFKNSVQKQRISSLEDVEAIVLKIREDWKIGLDPIHNIIQILEDQQIKVIEIAEEEKLFDGMATIIDDKYAVIVINKNFGIERKRFTLFHELGHLLLDLPECDIKTEENFCNYFAGEFLLPKSSLIDEFGESRNAISLKELITVQEKYGISVPAIIYRLVDSHILSKLKQQQFYIEMNTDSELKKLVNKERFKTPEYSNRYEQLVYRAYSQEFITVAKAASLLGKNVNRILAKEMI